VTTSTDRIATTLDAVRAAVAAHEQAIRDAKESGTSISDIGRALGIKDRTKVYKILGMGRDGAAPTRPSLTPVVYLRGAGVKQPAWDRIELAMWARGWDTTHDRTSAFHLARGGVEVVMLDFTSTYGNGLTRETITVGRVRARYGETPEWTTIGQMLPTDAQVELMREGAPWLDRTVRVSTQEMELPLVSGPGEIPRPYRRDDDGRQILDEHLMARAVADALGEQ
jgi:hypothetical protein